MVNLALAAMLVVRLYDTSAIGDHDRATAVAVASEILSAASVPTSWPDCRPSPGPKPQPHAFVCARPLAASELAVRIMRDAEPVTRTGRVPLGYSLVDRERGGGTLATVYLDRVERLAADSATPVAVLLGRAIAHEIGHLLLGDNSHTPQGLMRAIWSQQILRRNATDDWRFSADQAQALQLAVIKAQAPTRSATNMASVRQPS